MRLALFSQSRPGAPIADSAPDLDEVAWALPARTDVQFCVGCGASRAVVRRLPGGTVKLDGAVGWNLGVEGGQLVVAVVGGAPEAVGAVRQRVPGPHAGHFGPSPVLGQLFAEPVDLLRAPPLGGDEPVSRFLFGG